MTRKRIRFSKEQKKALKRDFLAWWNSKDGDIRNVDEWFIKSVEKLEVLEVEFVHN